MYATPAMPMTAMTLPPISSSMSVKPRERDRREKNRVNITNHLQGGVRKRRTGSACPLRGRLQAASERDGKVPAGQRAAGLLETDETVLVGRAVGHRRRGDVGGGREAVLAEQRQDLADDSAVVRHF